MAKKMVAITSCFLVCIILTAIILFWPSYNAQFYQNHDVVETCDILNLSSIDFCEPSSRVNHDDLARVLSTEYPANETTYYEIMDSIQETVYFSAGTCSDITPNTNNVCPEPSRCTSAYSCYVNTPVQRVHFGFNSEGALGGFTIPSNDS